jgi:hypothetical protein
MMESKKRAEKRALNAPKVDPLQALQIFAQKAKILKDTEQHKILETMATLYEIQQFFHLNNV